MARQRIETGSAFEFDSFWRVADGAEGAEEAQGRLAYDPATGIELAIVDLRAEGLDAFNSPAEIPVLHGHDLQGKPCTLFDAIAKETVGGPFGGHVRQVLTSNRFVYGAQLDSMEDLEVGEVIVDLWGLTEWVNGIWERPARADQGGDWRLSRLKGRLSPLRRFRRGGERPVELPEGEVLNVHLSGAHLLLQRSLATRDGRRAQNRREAHVTARFRLETATTYADFSERFVRPLHDLLILARHRPVTIDAVTVLVPYEEKKWWDREPLRGVNEVSIVERTSFDRASSAGEERVQIPMPLAAWEDSAANFIARWFGLRNELGGPANLLFATLNKQHPSLEGDVLNLLSVAEGYHRRMFDERPFSDQEHDEVLSLLGSIDDGARRNHYLARLRYANEPSQKQRVRALFERAEKVLPEVKSWQRRQLQPLIDTRNFLTHWGAPTDNVLEDWDLWFALNRVRIVLEINLYLDLGLEEETVSRAIHTAYHEAEFMGPA